MAGGAHESTELAAFQNGETRIVYARHRQRPNDPPFFLHDGQARTVRSWVSDLECFMPECDNRRLSVVARHPRRRDGFRHFRGAGGHGKVSLFHEQGKALIARWVRENYPDVAVSVEQATEDRSRIADVMLTWPDGTQMAVEVQYAALSVDGWLVRHESYRRQGIHCVWLLGHVGTHLKASQRLQDAAADTSVVRMSDLHRAMAKAGVPLLWLNPVDETLGTVYNSETVGQCSSPRCTYGHDKRAFPVAPHEAKWAEQYTEFMVSPLERSVLTRVGILTSGMRTLQEHLQHLRTAREQDRAAEAEHAHAVHERQRAQAAARRAREVERRRMTTPDRRDSDVLPPEAPVRFSPSRLDREDGSQCRGCGGLIDPPLPSGYHVLCWPAGRPYGRNSVAPKRFP